MFFGMLRSEANKTLKDFARKYGETFEESEKAYTATIPSAKVTDFKRLEKRVKSVRSSARLLPRNFLVALLCTYDAFLGKVIRYILTKKPQLLEGSERAMTFEQLLKFQDIAAAREYLVEKEIESVLRKSHVDHFIWLESKLNCSLRNGLEVWPAFVELTQRRNLFVHTDGVVSSQYLKICAEHKCELSQDIGVAAKLEADIEYFNRAFEVIYEIAIKLTQVVWRRLEKSEIKQAGAELSEISLELLDNGHYDIAIRVLSFFTEKGVKHEEESARRVHVINLAQAYKWNEREEDCRRTLDSCDWSGWGDNFKLALHVLREEWNEAFGCMRRLAHDEKFSRRNYREWPLFKKLRAHADFPAVYKECYDEDFPRKESVPRPKESPAAVKVSTPETAS
jgi:hypothetical protein